MFPGSATKVHVNVYSTPHEPRRSEWLLSRHKVLWLWRGRTATLPSCRLGWRGFQTVSPSSTGGLMIANLLTCVSFQNKAFSKQLHGARRWANKDPKYIISFCPIMGPCKAPEIALNCVRNANGGAALGSPATLTVSSAYSGQLDMKSYCVVFHYTGCCTSLVDSCANTRLNMDLEKALQMHWKC